MTTRRTKKARASKGVAADALLTLSRIALDSTAQAVCVYDADNRVVLLNRRYVEMFNMSAEVIRPGITYRQVLEHSAACGNFAPEAVDGILRERHAMIAARPEQAKREPEPIDPYPQGSAL